MNRLPDQLSTTALLVILAIALAVRLAMTVQFVGLGSPPDRAAGGLDVVDYEQFAYHMSIGKGYSLPNGQPSARRAPGTSLTILLPYLVAGRSYLAAHVFFCVLSALTCAAGAWTAGLAFGRTTGFLAGIGTAVYPGSAYYAMHFFSEVPAALALCAAAGLTIRSFDRKQLWLHAAAGLCWGAAILVRPQMIVMLPMAWGLVAVVRPFRSRTVFQGLAVQSVLVLAVVLPWVARNAVVMGKPTLGTVVGGVTFWGANNEFVASPPRYRGYWYFGPEVWRGTDWTSAKSEVEKDAVAWRHGKQFVRDHLVEMPGLTLAKLGRLVAPFHPTPNRKVYWAFALTWLAVAPALIAGVFLAFRKAAWQSLVLLLPILATVATAVVFYGGIRFRDGVAPFIMIFAAVSAARLLKPREFVNGDPACV